MNSIVSLSSGTDEGIKHLQCVPLVQLPSEKFQLEHPLLSTQYFPPSICGHAAMVFVWKKYSLMLCYDQVWLTMAQCNQLSCDIIRVGPNAIFQLQRYWNKPLVACGGFDLLPLSDLLILKQC